MSDLDPRLALWWEIAIVRKLRATALTDKRFDDANYYQHQQQAAEFLARKLLKEEAR